MNRLWIGVTILALLLAMGIGLLWGSEVFFDKFAENLEQAQSFAMAGNWAAAGEKAEKSRRQWETYHRFWAAFTDHEPVEEVEKLFECLQLYSKRQLEVDYATVCQSLVHLAEAINESHSLRWWSIL